MRIGLLSDSHGRSDRLRKAVTMLQQQGVDGIVHCGDLCDASDIDILAEAGCRVWLVAGNMDRSGYPALMQRADNGRVEIAEDFFAVSIDDGRHLAATHGHREDLLDELIRGGQYAYVCHGHTHRQRDERYGPTRVINPGALFHPRGTKDKTIALLDTHSDTIDWLVVP